ncbi:hypothetical protein K2W90_05780 [Candidatus Babeliales bacterium]|nr:hypothetical protein [Candidatus Babeliales bacterium]
MKNLLILVALFYGIVGSFQVHAAAKSPRSPRQSLLRARSSSHGASSISKISPPACPRLQSVVQQAREETIAMNGFILKRMIDAIDDTKVAIISLELLKNFHTKILSDELKLASKKGTIRIEQDYIQLLKDISSFFCLVRLDVDDVICMDDMWFCINTLLDDFVRIYESYLAEVVSNNRSINLFFVRKTFWESMTKHVRVILDKKDMALDGWRDLVVQRTREVMKKTGHEEDLLELESII